MPLTYTKISSTVLGSSQSSVTLSSIPNTYTDLMLMCSLKGDREGTADPIQMLVNGLSSGYSYTQFTSIQANQTSTRGTSDSRVYTSDLVPQAFFYSTGLFSNTQMYFPNYATDKAKPFMIVTGFTSLSSNIIHTGIGAIAALNSTTSAINSITIYGNGMIAGCSFYLYGIKNS